MEAVKVGIAEWQVARAPGQLITLGLGSCVGIALYDASSRIGGLAHIMLPDMSQFPREKNRAKFAAPAISDMMNEMLRRGARRFKLVAKIAGGAQMFSSSDRRLSLLKIGERNVAMVRRVLQELKIPLLNEDTGGNYGRTMILQLDDGAVQIRTIGRPLKTI